ncbi:hypothetical protein EDD18DRAFT_1108174 [Armillaria luteobubalina]|uniref:Uncharacterized protein n=1 Tax=Armillaria luteobubalina TaxID=153913 RepID=A0AA39UKR1_9AGAR|nr:hypothetical protein EDD18DRAFT_1108174 [Armillaria luteobubalina]
MEVVGWLCAPDGSFKSSRYNNFLDLLNEVDTTLMFTELITSYTAGIHPYFEFQAMVLLLPQDKGMRFYGSMLDIMQHFESKYPCAVLTRTTLPGAWSLPLASSLVLACEMQKLYYGHVAAQLGLAFTVDDIAGWLLQKGIDISSPCGPLESYRPSIKWLSLHFPDGSETIKSTTGDEHGTPPFLLQLFPVHIFGSENLELITSVHMYHILPKIAISSGSSITTLHLMFCRHLTLWSKIHDVLSCPKHQCLGMFNAAFLAVTALYCNMSEAWAYWRDPFCCLEY